jgi:hypothetical protein
MPFVIAAKAAFLIALTWEPNGFVKHQYVEEFPSPIECFKRVDKEVSKETFNGEVNDYGCTYLAPISKGMIFYRPKSACIDWEENGLFIKDTSYD